MNIENEDEEDDESTTTSIHNSMSLLSSSSSSLIPSLSSILQSTDGVLNLSNGNIKNDSDLPADLELHVHNIIELDLSSNQLRRIPDLVFLMPNLEILNLFNNSISHVGADVNNLVNLQTLNLRLNSLSSLPANLSDLPNLQLLDVADNQLHSIPSELSSMKSLRYLFLENNSIHSLPSALLRNPNLTLNIANNPCTIDQTSVSSSSPASSIMDNEMLIPKSSDTRRARNVLARKTSMRAQRQRHSHSFGNTARSNLVKSTPWGRKTKTTSRPKTTTTTSTTTTSTAQTSSPLSSRSRKRMHRPQKRMTANNAPNQSNLDRTMSIEDVSSSSSSSTSSKAQSPFKRRQWGSTSFTQSQSLPSHRDHMENNSSSSSVINFATLNRNLESLDDSGEYLNSSASSSSSSSSKPADYVGTPKTHLSSTDVAGSSSSVPTSTFSRRFFHGRKPSSSSSRLANKRKISSLKSDDDDDSDDQQLWDTSQDTDNDIASLQKNPIAKRRLQPNVKRRLTEHLFRQAKNEEKATKQLATKIEAMTERSQIERKKAENRLQQASLLHNQIAQFTEFLNQLQQDNVDFDDLEPLSENPMDDEIGAGSFGTVYKRKYQGTVVAVKEIKHIHLTPEHVEDFQREVSTLSRVRHPNVVHLIGAGWTDKRDKLSLFLVMEYLPGGTLYDLVHSSMFRKTPDVEGLLTHIALQIAAGMENLHRQQNIPWFH